MSREMDTMMLQQVKRTGASEVEIVLARDSIGLADEDGRGWLYAEPNWSGQHCVVCDEEVIERRCYVQVGNPKTVAHERCVQAADGTDLAQPPSTHERLFVHTRNRGRRAYHAPPARKRGQRTGRKPTRNRSRAQACTPVH